MPRDLSTYDDDSELTEYIWHNYRDALTEFEVKVWHSALADKKAETESEPKARMMRKHMGSQRDPEIIKSLERGLDVFRREVRDRILSEHSDRIVINRCSRCQRIVATPKARQCLWCGYDWHRRA